MILNKIKLVLILFLMVKIAILKIKKNYIAKKVLIMMMNIKNLIKQMINNRMIIQFWKGYFLKKHNILCTIFLIFMKT